MLAIWEGGKSQANNHYMIEATDYLPTYLQRPLQELELNILQAREETDSLNTNPPTLHVDLGRNELES